MQEKGFPDTPVLIGSVHSKSSLECMGKKDDSDTGNHCRVTEERQCHIFSFTSRMTRVIIASPEIREHTGVISCPRHQCMQRHTRQNGSLPDCVVIHTNYLALYQIVRVTVPGIPFAQVRTPVQHTPIPENRAGQGMFTYPSCMTGFTPGERGLQGGRAPPPLLF
jgi:hypothetical protein